MSEEAAPLAPFLALLGLQELPPDAETTKAAYKKSLRTSPGRVEELREALSVLTADNPVAAAAVSPVSISSKVLSIERKLVHKITCGHFEAASADGAACGHASAQGKRPSMEDCLLYTSPSPRDGLLSRMPSSA